MSKRPIHKYEEEQLKKAMVAIRNGKKIREASRVFGVPRGTLQDRLHLRVPEMPRKMGPDTILTKEEETALKDWCITLAKCGFPLKSDDLLNTVHTIISEENRPNPFVNNRPGKKWYQSFLRRNPELSERTPENISKGRAAVTEEGIRKWFAELLKHLEEQGASDILTMPDRIFNGDETSFYICPKSGKVIAPRGYKNVYKIVKGKEKEAITVLVFISAAGKTLPPCVVFPYVRPPKDVINSMPTGWLLGKSETGWMKSDIFFDYIVKGLNKWVDDQNIQKPVLVFVDGHKSHLTMRLSEYCSENGIILYALPPNATHLIQPADVSVFKPLKSEWKNTVHEWAIQLENVNTVLTKATFCPLMKKTLEKENLPATIINGFRKCGLYPYNPNALDYSKCVQNNLEKHQNKASNSAKSPGTKIKKSHVNTAIKIINQLSNDLENAGVDAKIVINVLKMARDTTGTESLNSTKNSTRDAIETDNISSISIKYRNKTQVASESVENLDVDGLPNTGDYGYNPDISLPIIGDYTLENNLANSRLNESDVPLEEFEIITEFKVVNHDHDFNTTPESEVIMLNVNHKELHDCDLEIATGDKVNQISNIGLKDYTENKDVKSEVVEYLHKIEDDKENTMEIRSVSKNDVLTKNMEVKSKECILRPIEIPNLMGCDNNTQNEAKESQKEKPVILSNIILKPGNLSPVLKKHLTLPSGSKTTKKKMSINRIGAISSEEWRQFEKQKEEVKEQKKNDILMNKIKRLKAKEKKQEEVRQRKEEWRKRKEELQKRKAERSLTTSHIKKKKNNTTSTVNKIKCNNCEEEMISDTEINDLKNIGCDTCPSWYHLKCTQFAGDLYENVFSKQFICETCKTKEDEAVLAWLSQTG